MKKPHVIALLILAIIVTMNIRTRAGSPAFNFSAVSLWTDEYDGVATALLKPGTYALWYLGLLISVF